MKLFNIIKITLLSAVIAACAQAPIPDDQKAPYRGEGEVSAVLLTDNNEQEISVRSPKGIIVVMLKTPVDVFPGDKVKVERQSGGYGTVTAR